MICNKTVSSGRATQHNAAAGTMSLCCAKLKAVSHRYTVHFSLLYSSAPPISSTVHVSSSLKIDRDPQQLSLSQSSPFHCVTAPILVLFKISAPMVRSIIFEYILKISTAKCTELTRSLKLVFHEFLPITVTEKIF